MADLLTLGLITVGAVFFIAGTVGLLRFPDLHCRLHALTKADNLGLGMINLGVALQVDSLLVVLKLVLIWALAILAAATTSQLIARVALPPALKRHKGDSGQ